MNIFWRASIVAFISISCGWLMLATHHILPDGVVAAAIAFGIFGAGVYAGLTHRKDNREVGPRTEALVHAGAITVLVLAMVATLATEVLMRRGLILGLGVRIPMCLLAMMGGVSGIVIGGRVWRARSWH
jgi:uncharacterized membrane protein YhiD involved in acid resistance